MKKITLFIFCLTILGCRKDWLDVKSDSKLTVPSTLSDLQGMLDDAQIMTINQPDKGEIASDGHFVTSLGYNNTTSGENKDAYIWSKTMRYTITGGHSWAYLYKKNLYCNIILDQLSKIDASSPEDTKIASNIKGQALFHRAFTYFQLAQLYSPQRTKENENSGMGVVMRLNTDITSPSKRVTIKESYDQIIKDLKDAADLLPDRPRILTRASRAASLALLSRVYLSIEDYENGFAAANDCLKIDSTLLDYNTVPPGNRKIGLYNIEVIFHANFSSSRLIGSQCLIDSTLVNSYNENDLRKTLFFRKNTANNYVFQGHYSDYNILFCGLAKDEVYLTRAECNARLNRLPAALNDLNTLIEKRWNKDHTFPGFTASSSEEALVTILTERNKSLILRGTRWTDLRRLNLDSRFRKKIERIIDDTTYILEANSYKYTFPIPDEIIEQTGVTQNQGWK